MSLLEEPPAGGQQAARFWLTAVGSLICLMALVAALFMVAGWGEAVGELVKGLGSLGTLAAVVVAVHAYQQKKEADERAEWWRRAQYALDSLTDKEKVNQEKGISLSYKILNSGLASTDDLDMFQEVIASITVQRDLEEERKPRTVLKSAWKRSIKLARSVRDGQATMVRRLRAKAHPRLPGPSA